MPEGLVPLAAAARSLGVGVTALKTAIAKGQVSTVQFGGRAYVTSEEVEATRTRLYGKADI